MAAEHWTDICALDDIVPDTGVCALLGKRQVAVFRVGNGAQVYALSNFDPLSKAFVLARGIVGDKDGIPKVASPVFKQSFYLSTGQCLEESDIRVPRFEARVRGGRVELLAESPGT
jgi:nitrite reductase (NADH) small subunit